MRIPLEYGDNFPVVPRPSWDPRVPWRFPHVGAQRVSLSRQILPWLMLGVGITLGVLWMSWRWGDLQESQGLAPFPSGKEGKVLHPREELTPRERLSPLGPAEVNPSHPPTKAKSRLA